MDGLSALILGIIQGLTEFLPVSSSGHLELGKYLLGDTSLPKESLLFTIVLHAATALSTVVVFRKDIAEILNGLLAFKNNEATQFSLKIILSMIPAALVGLFLEDAISQFFHRNLLAVGLLLCFTGLLLFLADRAKQTNKAVDYASAFWIGSMQAIAILPGISRSGATIATAVLLGIDKEKAAKFSFLMVIPLILGSMAKSFLALDTSAATPAILPLVIGFIAAFITGLLACKWMIALVKNAQLKYFSFYCIIVGGLALSIALG